MEIKDIKENLGYIVDNILMNDRSNNSDPTEMTKDYMRKSCLYVLYLLEQKRQPEVRSAEEVLRQQLFEARPEDIGADEFKKIWKDFSSDDCVYPAILKAMEVYADQFRSKQQANDTKPDTERQA